MSPHSQKESSKTEGGIRIFSARVTGSSHEAGGKPCQDACAFAGDEEIKILAVADGLSSASHAEEGAAISVQEATRIDPERPSPGQDPVMFIMDACHRAREAVIRHAAEAGMHPATYASTLIIAVYQNSTVTVGHIGDGIVIGVSEGRTHIVSPPESGEYANETACLVQPDWETHLRITPPGRADDLILSTDGCQAAMAQRSGGVWHPHDPFILPLISYIRKKITDQINPTADVIKLLQSSRMQNLSGDDKTLLILIGPACKASGP